MRISDVNDDSDGGAFTRVLAQNIRSLAEGGSLMIAEFGAGGVVRWEVWRDANGTPVHQRRPEIPWPDLCSGSTSGQCTLSPDTLSLTAIDGIAQPADEPCTLLVCSASEDQYAGRAADLVRNAHPDVRLFSYADPLADLLDMLLADDPLRQSFELVVLDQQADGQLKLGTLELFFPAPCAVPGRSSRSDASPVGTSTARSSPLWRANGRTVPSSGR